MKSFILNLKPCNAHLSKFSKKMYGVADFGASSAFVSSPFFVTRVTEQVGLEVALEEDSEPEALPSLSEALKALLIV
jgi:hypothetical protein